MKIKRILVFLTALMMLGAMVGCDDKEQVMRSDASVIEDSNQMSDITENESNEDYFESAEFTDWKECLTYENDTETEGIIITGCDKDAVNVRIPNEIDGYPVTKIESHAFEECRNLCGVIVGDNVQCIGQEAFARSGLEHIIIPNSVTQILGWAFDYTPLYECTESGVVYVDGWAVGCTENETEIVIKEGTRGIASYTFRKCENLQSVIIPDVKVITECLFLGCSTLETVVLGDGVEIINSCAFKDCVSLSDITLGNSITSIGSEAFKGDYSLKSIELPESLNEISNYAFECCRLSSIVIPENVEYIGMDAFNGCSSMESATIKSLNCEISEPSQIGETIPSVAMLYGFSGSTAEQYALNRGRDFMEVDNGTNENIQ